MLLDKDCPGEGKAVTFPGLRLDEGSRTGLQLGRLGGGMEENRAGLHGG